MERLTRRALARAALAAGLGLAACGGGPAPGTSGRGPAAASRIASQTLLSDEILWDLGPDTRARVVAVSALADDPRYSDRPHTWPDTVPRVPTGSEALLALAPDLVVVATFTAPEIRERLAHVGVAQLVLPPLTSTDAYRNAVHRIAEGVGAAAAGDDLVAAFDRALAEHTRRPPPGRRRTLVAYADGVVAGADTTFDEIARHAGFDNAAARAGVTGHARVDPERLLAWDPFVVVIPCGGDCGRAKAAFAATPGLSALSAVREGRVVPIEDTTLHATGWGLARLAARLCDEFDRFAAADGEGAP